MELTWISNIILTHRPDRLFDVTGPGNVDPGTQPKDQKATGVKSSGRVGTANAQSSEVATDYAAEDASQLPANKETAGIQSDPNARPQQRLAAQRAQEVEDVLKTVLDAKLSKDVDVANATKRNDLDRLAGVIYEKGKAQEVARQLMEAKRTLPLTDTQREAVDKIIDNLSARFELDGRKLDLSESATSLTHEEFKARKEELEQLETKLARFVEGSVGISSATKQQVVKAIKDQIVQLKRELASTQAEMAEARRQLAAATTEGRKAAIKEKIRTLTKKVETLQKRQRVLKLSQRLQFKVEEVRRGGNLEQTNKFFQIIQQGRADLGGKSVAEVLNSEAGLSALSDKEVAALEKIFDESFKAETVTGQSSSTSHAGQAAAPQMGIHSATAPQGGTGSDEPVEAVEGVKRVSEHEEVEGADSDSGEMGIFSADAEGHAEKVEGWENLSSSELSMQIASAGVTMGITSSYFRSKSDSKQIKKEIEHIIQSIERGNLDAISLALILIARRSKETLRKAALTVIQSLKYYEEQQEVVNGELAKLTGEETAYASNLQKLTSEMNIFSTNRQAAVSILRDIKSASDELDNTSKSWLDVDGPHGRAMARWTA